jgi:glycosyltransferase involved in cell wall biosynthesis
LKYWLLTTEYPPQFGGGIGTYCSQWSAILNQAGVELTVFILNNQVKGSKETRSENIRKVEFSPYLKDTSDFLGYETMVSSSFEEIIRLYMEKEGVPDWLEAQEYQGIAYYILQKKHLGETAYKDLKILITCHCPSFITFEHNHISPYQLPYFWIAEMERFCMKAADLCIFPSKYLSDDILKRYPGLIKDFAVLHNPYFVSNDLPADKSMGQIDFVVIGKLSPAKGILNTVNVFDGLWKKGASYKLKLVGDENYFYHAAGTTTGDYLKKRYSSQLRSGLLTISGALPPGEIRKEILGAKIVLVPSTIENLPYTVIEAMSAGKIVLASAQGGQSEIIRDAHNGFLFDYNDPTSFAEKIHVVQNIGANEIIKIGNEAIRTIKDECDPGDYFTKKIALLNQFEPSIRSDFPFVSSNTIKALNGDYLKETGLLSVVVPYFNMGEYINDAIASIERSSYSNKEIIVVNDGSNDAKSLSALDLLKTKPGITIIDQPNRGLSAARNRGAQEANGRYLAFLDADDKVAVNYYEKAIDILRQKSNIHFVGCWVQYFGDSDGKWPAFTPEPPFLLYHNMINSSSLVYKKESFLKHGLNDAGFVYGMEDYDSVISLVKNGCYGVVMPEFLFFYRIRKNSMAKGFNKSNRLYLYQLLAGKHREFYATFAAELFGLLNANGPGIFVDNPSLDYHLAEKIPFAGKLSKKLIYLVKKNKLTRKAAFKIYRLLNK